MRGYFCWRDSGLRIVERRRGMRWEGIFCDEKELNVMFGRLVN